MRRGKRGNSRWGRKREGDAKKESRGGTWRAMRGAEMRRIEGEIEWVEWVEGEIEWVEKEIGRIEWVEREIEWVEWAENRIGRAERVALVAWTAFEGFQSLMTAVAVP